MVKLSFNLKKDYYRFFGNKKYKFKNFKKSVGFQYIYYWRKAKENNLKIIRLYYKYKLHKIVLKTNTEIPLSVSIGDGALLIHPYSITINSSAIIGKNFTMLKGATIGNSKTGKNMGSPIIGDNVYIGLNAVVVGKVKIGNNVLIAANSFVNFDVPDNSIVIGNPGVIHHKENASSEYITNKID